MSEKYIRISKRELESILLNAVAEESKEVQSINVSAKTLILVNILGTSIVARVMNSLPKEVYESDDIDFPNSN